MEIKNKLEKHNIDKSKNVPECTALGTQLFSVLYEQIEKTIANPKLLLVLLNYMRTNQLISNSTFIQMINIIPRNGWTCCVRNDDINLYTSFNDEMKIDWFAPRDLIAWVQNKIMKDISRYYDIKQHDITGLTEYLNSYTIPELYYIYHESLIDMYSSILINGSMYYLLRDESTTVCSYSLYKLKIKALTPNTKISDISEELESGLNARLWYKDEYLYANYSSLDAYMKLSLKTLDKKVIYRSDLVKIDDKNIWTSVRENPQSVGVRTLQMNSEMIPLSPEENYTFIEDRLVVYPFKTSTNIFLPYYYNKDSTKELCDIQYTADLIWKRFLKTSYIYSSEHKKISYGIEETLLREDLFSAPSPFVIETMRERINNFVKKGILLEYTIKPLFDIFDILENTGFLFDELTTVRIMYTLWKYYNQCVEDFWNIKATNKKFYIILQELSQQNDFIELLLNNPYELFKDKIIPLDDNRLDRMEDRYYYFDFRYRTKIGYFDIKKDGAISYEFEELYNGYIEGDYIKIENRKNYNGAIYYNKKYNKYTITIDSKDICAIEKVKQLAHISDEYIMRYK